MQTHCAAVAGGRRSAHSAPRVRRYRWLATVLCCFAGLALAQAEPTDEFLAGYLASILEQRLGWARDSYHLEVHQGIATLRLIPDDAMRERQVMDELRLIEGLQGLNIASGEEEMPPSDSAFAEASKRLHSILGITVRGIAFPIGDVFVPLLADIKQPRFFVSLRSYNTEFEGPLAAAVGYGETFGLLRREGKALGDGIQLSVAGALFAQFNLDSPSNDLVNADYTIGLPISYRKGDTSARLRLFHQSSHLGDEFLLRVHPERVNLSYEALDLVVSQEYLRWRVYGGGEYLLHREPTDLDRASAQMGIEYRGLTTVWRSGRLIGAVELRSQKEHEWRVSTSAQLGLVFGLPQPGGRRVALVLEGYEGFSPYGQFYRTRTRFLGAGVYLGF